MTNDLFASYNEIVPSTNTRRPRKGAIIGAGQVGMACAYSLLIQSTFDELVLVDSEVPVWSRLNVAGTPLLSVDPQLGTASDPEHWSRIFEQVKNAAYEIIQRKGATSYAIGLAVTQIAQAVLRDQQRVMTVSCLVNGLYGIEDVYLSLPAVVNRHGVNRIVQLSLSVEEQQKLQRSAKLLRQAIEQLQL